MDGSTIADISIKRSDVSTSTAIRNHKNIQHLYKYYHLGILMINSSQHVCRDHSGSLDRVMEHQGPNVFETFR